MMKQLLAGLICAASLATGAAFAHGDHAKPAVVLVHGAFADASSWNGVAGILARDGYAVIAAANPLRGVASDAAYLRKLLKSIDGPVVLVGHSYGGEVISEAALGLPKVQALVYVSAFAPDVGESASELSALFPGSTLGDALAPPVPLGHGEQDLYIRQDLFRAQFAADVPAAEAQLMAIEQRPIAQSALDEAATYPAWKSIPSWFIYGSKDKNIPPRTVAYMARRAQSRETIEVRGASHVVMVSHPDAVADLIERAASAR